MLTILALFLSSVTFNFFLDERVSMNQYQLRQNNALS